MNVYFWFVISVLLIIGCDSKKSSSDDSAGDTLNETLGTDTEKKDTSSIQHSDSVSEPPTTDDVSDQSSDSASDAPTTDDVSGDDTEDVPNDEIGNTVFDENELRSYYITISDSEYEKLMDMDTLVTVTNGWPNVNKDRYVDVALQVGDTVLPSVAMRFKGDWSIIGCFINDWQPNFLPEFGDIDVCQRLSFKLDINKYDKDGRLDGLKKINFHAMSADATKMHERLAYDLFREMDILGPRAVHAKVYINGEYHGLFLAVEQLDGRFTANRFPAHGDGNLYKQIWPQSEVDEHAAKGALKTNDDDLALADVSDFIAFRDSVLSATASDFSEVMAKYLDFDYLARYLVVDRAITNFDGILSLYEGMYNHNFYWYHEEESGRFTLIPWDMDKTFIVPEPNFWFMNSSEPTNPVIPECSPSNLPNWNVVSSDCSTIECFFDCAGYGYNLKPHYCDPLLSLLRDEIYPSQAKIAQDFIDGAFSTTSVSEKVRNWQMQIGDALDADPLLNRTQVDTAIDELLNNIPTLQENLTLIMGGLVER